MTTWFRRLMAGALTHQHQPLATEDHDHVDDDDGNHAPDGGLPGGGVERHAEMSPEYQAAEMNQPLSWWQRLLRQIEDTGRPRGNYEAALQHETEHELGEDEEAQLEQAIRNSLQDGEGSRGHHLSNGNYNDGFDESNPDNGDEYSRSARNLMRGELLRIRERKSRAQEEQEEAEAAARAAAELESEHDPDLRAALELSRREASAAGGASKAKEELPDLLSFEPQPRLGDLMGLDGDHAHAQAASVAAAEEDQERRRAQQQQEEQLRNDELLARSLQEELYFAGGGSGSPGAAAAAADGRPPSAVGGGGSGGRLQLPFGGLFSPAPAVTCGGCKQAIAGGRFLKSLGASWHPHCFKCAACARAITDREFKAMGSDPYHSECYRKLFHPVCAVCHSFIPTREGGLIEYRSLPFWGHKHCPAHETDGTPRCSACQRLEPRDVQYIELADGRKLCLECLDSAVVDTDECTPLFLSILAFYEGLAMPIRAHIPLLCVETQALNAAREGEKDGHHHSPETRGLCLSEEQTIQTVYRAPGYAGGNRLGGISQQQQTLHRHCQVTAILVLYGLPQLLTGSILAHELMHAYIKLDGSFPPLSPEVEEGICQVMAHLWLQSQASPQQPPSVQPSQSPTLSASPSLSASASSPEPPASGQQDFRERFAQFCMHQIASDPSAVYGEGFRAGHAAVVQFGLKATLDHIRLTSSFP